MTEAGFSGTFFFFFMGTKEALSGEWKEAEGSQSSSVGWRERKMLYRRLISFSV